MHNESLEQEPYFHVKIVNGRPRISGQKERFLGHVVQGESDYEREGIFVEWEWDGSALRIKTDKFAFYPVYYWCGKQEFAISTSIVKLFELGVPKELDYDGLGVFLRLGFHIGEFTSFKNIKTLPPSGDLQWSQGQLTIKSHIKVEKANKIRRDEAIDQYIYLFMKSIEKRLPKNDNFVVPLSGGRDSRHILFELVKQGHRPRFCVTHEHFAGGSLHEDVQVASELCRELKIGHIILKQKEKFSRVECRKNCHTNYCTDEHSQMYVLADYIEGKAEILYDGIGGDTLSEGHYRYPICYNLYKEQKYKKLAIECFRRFCCDENDFRRIFHKQFYDKINFDQAISNLVLEIKKHESAPDPFATFVFWNRTRREIALLPYRVLEKIPVIFTPYLDHELYRYLSSLPATMLINKDFHTDCIYRAYPKYAHMRYENMNSDTTRSVANSLKSVINKQIASYYILQSKFQGHVWNQKYVLPRMLRCLISTRYAISLNRLPMNRFLFLTQLENLCRKDG